MISVSRNILSKEPDDFDEKCRKKGVDWLARNPKATRKAKRPKDFWSPFRPTLADAFSGLCAYGAMYEPSGTVDHFIPVDADETLAYEWQNYRYATGWINSSKSKRSDVLDAFQVEPDWFELLLPSLQLVAIKANIPVDLHDLVDQTLQDLHLVDDERIVRQRRAWLKMYETGKITLEGLKDMAPLLAVAIEKRDGRP
jgi:hypothetical protein